MWQIRYQKKFSKFYAKLSDEEQKLLDNLIFTLASSDNPNQLSHELIVTRLFGKVLITKLNSSCRLAYSVFHKENIIELIAVGDHKTVIGKD